jgi:hypothetical protein
VEYDCPICDAHQVDGLQTHFMGDFGSCVNYYVIDQPVEELRGIHAAGLGEGMADDFVSVCRNCRGFVDWGARIENEAVVEVWPYRWTRASVGVPT